MVLNINIFKSALSYVYLQSALKIPAKATP